MPAGKSHSGARLLRPVGLEKMRDRRDAQIIMTQAELFVGPMQPVVRQTKAHQYGRNAQMRGKIADNRDGTAAADEYRGFAQHTAEDLGRNVNCRMMGIYQNRRACAQHVEFYLNALRLVGLHPGSDSLNHPVRFLVRYQTQADLRRGAGRDNGFGALGSKAARNTVHFEGRASPNPRQNTLIRLSDQSTGSDFFLKKLLLGEGKTGPALQLLGIRRRNIVIDAGNENASVSVFSFCEQLDQTVDRVGRRAAIHARMQVARWARRLYLEIDEPSQAHAQRRDAIGKHFSIGDQSDIRSELLSMLPDVLRDRFATDLLFALNQEFDIQRQLAFVHAKQSFNRLHVREHLALVISSAARVKIAVANDRFKRL